MVNRFIYPLTVTRREIILLRTRPAVSLNVAKKPRKRRKNLKDQEIIFHNEGAEALELVAQRCPIPGNIPGQVGRGSEQPGLVGDVPAHCRGAGLDDL